ncbi:MAG TPA: nucleotidyltransferase domain-containing protein [Gaiellaceae bacterium]|nr:nucleotidyltransferase domain-containing protein [Gaiellaceae bacterium]
MNARLIDVMDLSRPWALIRSPIDMDVLLVLRGTTRPLTGRDVARLVRNGSQPTVNASLRRLTEEGLVRAEEAGNAYLYTFNREHLGAPAIELLTGIRSELERRLRAEIGGWEIAPAHASIFGSAARGEGDTRSDIDVFVVRPARVSEDDPRWRAQLERLSDHVYEWTGNHAGLSEVSAADVRRLRHERPPVVEELRRDAITLAGPAPTELLKATE